MGLFGQSEPSEGPAAAPHSPPRGNLPTTPHPRQASSALGQPSTPPRDLTSPGQPSILADHLLEA